MKGKIFQQIIIFALSGAILFYSGKFLLEMDEFDTLFEGFVIIVFFLSLFPFLDYLLIILKKILKLIF